MTSKRLYQRKPCKPFWDVVRANCIDSTGEACSHGAATQINTLGSYGTWTQRSRKSPKKLRCRRVRSGMGQSARQTARQDRQAGRRTLFIIGRNGNMRKQLRYTSVITRSLPTSINCSRDSMRFTTVADRSLRSDWPRSLASSLTQSFPYSTEQNSVNGSQLSMSRMDSSLVA